ncbi:Uncharacterized protein APZ42_004818 [Daphnia magna]|uniref:Uncharacterized protein n=2 Tax=Daphnia magna TaxID=35525 RepID=A0ABR0AJF1_9CRUS|nr:hypothetical protein OUZ56_014317 [Daphnia magna]KZR99346.1 Uncharacterized protein APZ42_004818 [Daphnia magna]
MTGNSPEPDLGRAPENGDENNPAHDEFNADLTDRDLAEVEDSEEPQEIRPNGYELLPTSNCENEDDNEDDNVEFGYSTYDGQEFQIRTSHDYHNLVTIETSTPAVSCSEKPSIPLDTTQIETIKSIMSKVILPNSAIPVWAHSITDEQLKQVVDEKVGKEVDDTWAVFD